MSRNLTDALTSVLEDVIHSGVEVNARGQSQLEVRAHLLKLEKPQERVLLLPGRRNNIFAQIAETAWVLAGRNDLEFLSLYLPRAVDFSDDGRTWRAAYGPRLRRWGDGIDQLKGVISRLTEDPYSKRAVISIFDPNSDYGETKDVPCNNWLNLLQRSNHLHLNVAVRANDAIWGFSGINVFEWSVLQEIIAVSIDSKIGEMTWFAGSMHVYERHYETAKNILRNISPTSPYHYGVDPIAITVSACGLDQQLKALFSAEDLARKGNYIDKMSDLTDPFFYSSARMLQIYNMVKNDETRDVIVSAINQLPPSDFRVAAVEYLSRRWGPDFSYRISLTAEERAFLEHHFRTEHDLSHRDTTMIKSDRLQIALS